MTEKTKFENKVSEMWTKFLWSLTVIQVRISVAGVDL